MVHATSFAAYAFEHLESSPDGTPGAGEEEREQQQARDRDSCVRMRFKISAGETDDLFMLTKAERGETAINGIHQDPESGMMEEEDSSYEDPVYDGPGPGYQCPLDSCSFRTSLEVSYLYYTTYNIVKQSCRIQSWSEQSF